ncbi:hypothetical protein B0H16DRAFT_861110 [Mycena metata]|uniref:Uncharacterized protein n=1 Tax=Mycena metata TaxID=1033252 RepID=A0AAD7GLX7_9AGAR|nr:hypothetical protein B0H16DRAFT_861110 [Mycena metata]
MQRLAKISGDVRREAHGLYHESLSVMSQGDYRECIALTRRGRTALSLCGFSQGQLNYGLMGIQAEVHKLKSEYSEAQDIQSQIFRETTNDKHQQAFSLMNIAEIEVMIGIPKTKIQKAIDASQAISRASENSMMTLVCDATQADLNLREGDMSSTPFRRCLQVGWGTFAEVVSFCLERLANISRWEAFHPTSWPTVYLAHSLKVKESLGIYKALQFLGDVFLWIHQNGCSPQQSRVHDPYWGYLQ